MHAEVIRPVLSISSALSLYRDQWKNIELQNEDEVGGVPPDIAKLTKLRKLLLPGHDLMAHRTHPLVLKDAEKNSLTGSLTDTQQAGDYTIRVIANGVSRKTKTAFQRTEVVTVRVHD